MPAPQFDSAHPPWIGIRQQLLKGRRSAEWLCRRAAQDDLGVERLVAQPLVEREQPYQPRLVRRAQDADAARLRPRELTALDRAGDAAATLGTSDRHEAVPPNAVALGEEAV